MKDSGPSDRRQDSADLKGAREGAPDNEDGVPWYKAIGPGLVTGAADDDPSGIGTYSANGAQFGYGLLWLVPLSIPLMITVQEMCGRLTTVTGSGLAAVIKANYSRKLLFACVGMLVIANVFNVFADLNVMAATIKMLFGLPTWAGLTLLTLLLVSSQILVPYRLYVKILKWLCLALAGYTVVAMMPGVHLNWGAIAHGLVTPRLDVGAGAMMAIVAFLGTTISPYCFFWQSGETLEDEVASSTADGLGNRISPPSRQEFKNVRNDTITGMVASQVVAFSIVIAAAGTLHASGKVDIETAQDAAKALLPLGASAYWIFALCMLGTGLLAIPTLAGSAAYAVAETFGWREGLFRRFTRAKRFYLIVVIVIALGCLLNFLSVISPIKALVYSAVLNGVIAPPLIVVLLFICNNKAIVGKNTNGWLSNTLGWLCVAIMGPAAVYMIYAMVTGQA
jgi:NRAMP (natural resistance-associated macrophage protein)-like metal ion transporter